MDQAQPIGNPDQHLISQFQAGGGMPIPVASNPLAVALNAQICHADAATGVVLEFRPDRIFLQGADVLQGGIVASMLDFAMAFAVLAALPDTASCATANLNVAFLRAAHLGTYRAVGQIERVGRTLAFARSELRAADAAIVATASSTLAIRSG